MKRSRLLVGTIAASALLSAVAVHSDGPITIPSAADHDRTVRNDLLDDLDDENSMPLSGSNYDLSWHKIAAGGETFSTGGGYELGATIGQHDAGAMSSGSYELAGGFWSAGSVIDQCPILADLNCDGVVDGSDLLILLSAWGECSDPGNCPADLNNDGFVDGSDLLIMLSSWG
jgi:hypothetical protein